METIDNVLSEADRAWRAYGVGSTDRRALAADLRLDLAAAVADGGDPAQLVGSDVAGFARRLADEAGVRRVRPDYRRLLLTALAGALLGSLLGAGILSTLYPLLVYMIDIPRSITIPVQVAVGVYYGVPSAVVVAGAVLTVRHRLRDLPEIRRTALLMSLLLPAAGLIVTPITVAYAWSTNYSTAPEVVAIEIIMVLAALAGATVLARRLSLRERRPVTGAGKTSATVEPA